MLGATFTSGNLSSSEHIFKREAAYFTGPGLVKYAASLLKICSEELRLPLVTVAPNTKKEIKSILTKLKIKPIKKNKC